VRKRSDSTLGPGVRFAWQHNPLPVGPDTVRLFDNENNGEPGGRAMATSRVVWIRLDTAAAKATLVKTATHPARLSVPSQGNAQALENGDTFVGWGQLGRVSEFDSGGKLPRCAPYGGRRPSAAWPGDRSSGTDRHVRANATNAS
jgi:hypothetical protein